VLRVIASHRFDAFDTLVPKLAEALIGVAWCLESLRGRPFGSAPEPIEALLLLELAAEVRGLLNPEAGAAHGAERENDSECEKWLIHIDLLMYSLYTSMYTTFTANVNTVY
jgi:hypothetical protein